MSSAAQSYAQQQLTLLNTQAYSSLIPLFEQVCEQYGDKPAFNCIGQTLSFNDIEQKSRQVGAFFHHKLGLKPGDRIAIQLPNLIQYPIVAWAAIRSGLIIVNTNPMYTERELLHQFNDSGAKALVVLDNFLPLIEKVVPQTGIETVICSNVFDLIEAQPRPESTLPNLFCLPEALSLGNELQLPTIELAMNDVALLQYTGGTTGPAKGAVLSHGNIFAGSQQSGAVMSIPDGVEQIVIGPMPIYHIYGFTMHNVKVFTEGGLSVLIPNPRDIDSMVNTMKEYQLTSLAGVNTLFVGLMQHPDFDKIDFSQTSAVIAGGAALVKAIADEWKTRTGIDIIEGYGLSETTATATCNSPEQRKLGTIGKPMISTEFRVIDKDGTVLAPGNEGELCLRGPQVMQGYWQRPEATAEAIDSEGWFRTGDIAVIQEDGFIRIADRLKDMILVSGFNVYPNEIEAVATEHPDIVECAAIGVQDDKTGEAVKLFAVISNAQLNKDDLISYLKTQLVAYKVPKQIEFVADLPKSNVGKILRRELRDANNSTKA